jgi:hypothetical protein
VVTPDFQVDQILRVYPDDYSTPDG